MNSKNSPTERAPQAGTDPAMPGTTVQQPMLPLLWRLKTVLAGGLKQPQLCQLPKIQLHLVPSDGCATTRNPQRHLPSSAGDRFMDSPQPSKAMAAAGAAGGIQHHNRRAVKPAAAATTGPAGHHNKAPAGAKERGAAQRARDFSQCCCRWHACCWYVLACMHDIAGNTLPPILRCVCLLSHLGANTGMLSTNLANRTSIYASLTAGCSLCALISDKPAAMLLSKVSWRRLYLSSRLVIVASIC